MSADEAVRDMRGIDRCSRYLGWHVYGAGPCFDRYEQALRYREELDREGIKWKPQGVPR